jgi:hypothetical protein
MDARDRHTTAAARAALARRKQPPTFNHLRSLGLGTLLWICCCAHGARSAAAQENAEAPASRALFDEARRLMNAGQFAAACPKLEESQRLRAGIGTQFNLAECYEKLGRFASAWSLYSQVATDTKALGQPEREQVARERARALEPRVSYLLLSVPASVAGLELTLDGSALLPALWGAPTPLDPGEHAIVAQAPGHATWQGVARVPDHAARIQLEIPELALSAAAPRAARSAAPPLTTTGATAHAALAPKSDNTPGADTADSEAPDRTVPYVIGGVGLGLVAISGLFGLRFLHDNAEAKGICSADPNACPPADIEHHEALLSSAAGARKAGFATLALGVVSVGVSAVWLWESRPEETTSASTRVVLSGQLGPSHALLGCAIPF